MRYLSVCSGIEAATVAWHHMGWEPVAFSEIEKFPGQVLKHHYPSVPNVGDMTKFEEWNLESVELLVGGTPCQSFSVAGLRKGLDDPRGNLMLTYGAIAKRFKPKWLVWENVPGVLSSNGGRDFGTFLGMLAELGYGFAYRVLDAQYFGVAQRRRRVFVVGCLGNWRNAAAVLFERDSLCGNPAPSREKGKGITAYAESSLAQYRPDKIGGTIKASGGCLAGGSETFVTWPAEICSTLNANFGSKLGLENQHINEGAPMFVPYDLKQVTSKENHQLSRKVGDPCHTLAKENACGSAVVAIQGNLIGRDSGGPQGVGASDDGVMYTLTKADVHGVAQPIAFTSEQTPKVSSNLAHTLTNTTFKHNQMVAFSSNMSVPDCQIDVSPTLKLGGKGGGNPPAVAQPINVLGGQHPNAAIDSEKSPTLTNAMGSGGGHVPIIGQMAVRRLTPVECERLQGFPDNYTNIKDNCPDGPRYKALGNSMAVPVMRWIGERIQVVERI
jgi:DNA (cytosine-5)-methyltransferase 1